MCYHLHEQGTSCVPHLWCKASLCKRQRQVWSFKHGINHMLNKKEGYCLIRCILCLLQLTTLNVNKVWGFILQFFFLHCVIQLVPNDCWIPSAQEHCHGTYSSVWAINYKFTYKFTDLSGGTYRSNWLYPRQKRTDVEIFFDQKKKKKSSD